MYGRQSDSRLRRATRCLLAPEAGPWHPIKGAFEIAFWAIGRTPRRARRWSKFSLKNWRHQRLSYLHLTNDGNWHQYVYTFTGTDVSWSGGQHQQSLNFTLTAINITRGSRRGHLHR